MMYGQVHCSSILKPLLHLSSNHTCGMYGLVGFLQQLNAAFPNARLHIDKSKHHDLRAFVRKLPIGKIVAGFEAYFGSRLEKFSNVGVGKPGRDLGNIENLSEDVKDRVRGNRNPSPISRKCGKCIAECWFGEQHRFLM